MVDIELDGAARQAAQLFVGTEDLGLYACHHARNSLVGDLREGFFAEAEEHQISAIAQQQKLEVVMPHPEVTLEGLLVGDQQVVVGRDAATGMHML